MNDNEIISDIIEFCRDKEYILYMFTDDFQYLVLEDKTGKLNYLCDHGYIIITDSMFENSLQFRKIHQYGKSVSDLSPIFSFDEFNKRLALKAFW